MVVKKPRSLWRSDLGILVITSGLWNIGGNMTYPFWALYVLYLGGNYFHIGLISGVSTAIGFIPSFFGGYLADTFSRKKIVYGIQVLIALDTLIYVFASSWEWLLVARSIEAVFLGLRQPAFNALLADSTNAESRALSYGLWNAIPALFGLLSPYLIGVLMDRYGILPAQRWAYVVLMVAVSITALIRYIYLNETLPSNSRAKLDPISIIRGTLKDFKKTARVLSRQVWVLVLLGCLFQFGASVGSVFMVTYAVEDVIRLTSSDWGLIITASTVITIASSIPLALLADRYGRRKLMLVSLLMTPLAVLGFTYSMGFSQVFLFCSILTLCGSMGSVASQALFTDYSPREHRGRINALTSVIGSTQSFSLQMTSVGIIGATGNIVGGILYEETSYILPFIMMASTIGLTALIAILYIREPVKREV